MTWGKSSVLGRGQHKYVRFVLTHHTRQILPPSPTSEPAGWFPASSTQNHSSEQRWITRTQKLAQRGSVYNDCPVVQRWRWKRPVWGAVIRARKRQHLLWAAGPEGGRLPPASLQLLSALSLSFPLHAKSRQIYSSSKRGRLLIR